MSVVSFLLFAFAAVLFAISAVVHDTGVPTNPAGRRYFAFLRWGLVVLTLAFIAQFIITNRPIHT